MPTIYVRTEDCKQDIDLKEGENIALALLRAGIKMPYSCGGKGSCKACLVWISDSWQLACQVYPKKDVRIERFGWQNKEDKHSNIVGVEANAAESYEAGRLVIAIDVGTTTLAAALVDCASKAVLATASATNSQQRYGLDVLSRIRSAVEGNEEELRQLILQDIHNLLQQLMARTDDNGIEAIYVTGNTTMEHLIMGASLETLGQAPFMPVFLTEQRLLIDDIPLILLPGISAFVGADIAAGIYASGMRQIEGPTLLLDLGTNGEMALKVKDKIYTTSAPAGPAFEGGNISCGMGSVPGAVSKVRIVGKRAIISTIDAKPAIGICGTGVLELLAELIDNKLIDETGRLTEPYQRQGYPFGRRADGTMLCFTQQDIREVQMAKAAIRSGIDLLVAEAGITLAELEQVYLAGGFGYYLNVNKAVRIGLIPAELETKTKAAGNTALEGCIAYALNPMVREEVAGICKVAEHMNLAEKADFEEQYLQYMKF